MDFNFEKLDVYQKAVNFADTVYEATKNFPQEETYGLTSQFRRAAVSVSLNIAEGSGRNTKGDRVHFYTMARGSIFECIPLTEIATRRDYLSDEAAKRIRNASIELSKMLLGLIKSPGVAQ